MMWRIWIAGADYDPDPASGVSGWSWHRRVEPRPVDLVGSFREDCASSQLVIRDPQNRKLHVTVETDGPVPVLDVTTPETVLYGRFGRDELIERLLGLNRFLLKRKSTERYDIVVDRLLEPTCCEKWRGKVVSVGKCATPRETEWLEAKCLFCPECGKALS